MSHFIITIEKRVRHSGISSNSFFYELSIDSVQFSNPMPSHRRLGNLLYDARMHSRDWILNSPLMLKVTTIEGGVSIGAGATVYYQIWCWSRRWEEWGKHSSQTPTPSPTKYCTKDKSTEANANSILYFSKWHRSRGFKIFRNFDQLMHDIVRRKLRWYGVRVSFRTLSNALFCALMTI